MKYVQLSCGSHTHLVAFKQCSIGTFKMKMQGPVSVALILYSGRAGSCFNTMPDLKACTLFLDSYEKLLAPEKGDLLGIMTNKNSILVN
jgi:hypothetical protein